MLAIYLKIKQPVDTEANAINVPKFIKLINWFKSNMSVSMAENMPAKMHAKKGVFNLGKIFANTLKTNPSLAIEYTTRVIF